MMNGEAEVRVRLDGLLRSCIQCGLCLPGCATYLATGNETLSPRGRLLLLGEWLEQGGDQAPPDTLRAFDLCLGCRACETACPSGVAFDLLAWARERADRASPARARVAAPLASRPVLSVLGALGGAARRVLAALIGATWRRRLESTPAPLRAAARSLGTLPASPSRDGEVIRLLDRLTGLRTPTGVAPSRAVPTGDGVTLFAGCANAALTAGTQRRLVDLLEASGLEVRRPGGQDCCGALDHHLGDAARAGRRRDRNAAALAGDVAATGALLVEAAGCGLELKGYPPEIADRVVDVVAFLADRPLPPLRTVPLTVAFHDACHARHGQGLVDEPRRLLDRIPGLERREPAEAEVCCGSGGVYSLFHADLSAAMGRRKARCLAATGADLVVTTNPGCLGQIADGLALEAPGLPVLPLSDLLWYATLSQSKGAQA